MKKGDLVLVKNTNMSTILEIIRTEGTISRAHISRLTGLSRSTCSILVDEMISEGLVIEMGKEESSGGRKAILLKLNYDGGRAIGIKVMQNCISAALVDLSGKIIKIKSGDFPDNFDESGFINILISVVNSLSAYEKNNTNKNILGIGIGVGGKIDFHTGTLIQSSIINLRNVQIGKILKEETGIPVYLENDVNAFAVGEKYFGAGLHYHNLLCVTVGQGIGAGIIVDDSLFRGSHHIAGEFGHIRITDSDSAASCTCGKKGCLEAYSSNEAIINYFLELTGKKISIDKITALAEKGDRSALEVFRKAGTYLGYGISTLINLFDPEIIIIGGEGAVYYKYMESEISRVVKEDTVYGLYKEVEIKPVLFDANLWIRGAAALVVREVFRKKT